MSSERVIHLIAEYKSRLKTVAAEGRVDIVAPSFLCASKWCGDN